MVLPQQHAVIFVHGCFWHLHRRCADGRVPKSQVKYWRAKLEGNCVRDRSNFRRLRSQGWKVLRIWECEAERNPRLVKARLARALGGRARKA
jgi:DNA mismatch endonuclease (patch repair protein)